MGPESGNEFYTYLAMVSNPARKRIIEVLSSFPSLPYLKLMSECHLSHPSQCGVFTYHLRRLIDVGAVERRKDKYSLTFMGRGWAEMTKEMEGRYIKKEESEEREFDIEKWCPLCLETQLKANVTPETIRIKCKNPKCIVGGPIDRAPFYIATTNKIPDWRKRHLDIYDLIHKSWTETPNQRFSACQSNRCLKCGSKSLLVDEFGSWYNKHCRDCDYGWGGAVLSAWDLPETVAFLRKHHKVAETFLAKKVNIDGKTCWGTTYTDLDTNEKLVMYADVETFRPVKVCIDFEGKPVEGEMTTEELVEKFLSLKKS